MRWLFALLFLFSVNGWAATYSYTYSWNGQFTGASCAAVAASLDGAYPIGGGATRVCTGTPNPSCVGAGCAVKACSSTNMSICNDIQYTVTVIPDPPTCTPPKVLNTAQTACVDPPVTCPSAGTSGGSYHFTVPPGGSTPDSFQEYDGSCVLSTGDAVCTVGADGSRHCTATTKYTGQACPAGGCSGSGVGPSTPAPSPTKDVPAENNGPCQAGYYYGTVNGVTMCVAGQGTESKNSTTTTTTNADGSGKTTTTTSNQTTGTSSNGTTSQQLTQQTLETLWEASHKTTFSGAPSVPPSVSIPTTAGQTKTTTVTNADGSVTKYDVKKNADGTTEVTTTNGTVKNTTNTTQCTGTTCTSTTTETTNGTKTSETSGQSSLDGLCKANPDLKLCGTDKEGSFQGVCESGYTCEGDAVQCAQALAIRELQCSAKKLPDGVESETADLLQGKVPDGFHMDGPALSPPTAVTGSCGLTDFQVAWIFESTLSVEMSRFCQFMDAIRAVIGIMGALAFATIVFKG